MTQGTDSSDRKLLDNIKDQLENEDIEELFEAFSLFDKDYNAVITSHEIGTIMRSINLKPTEDELKDMINEAETNHDNMIDFPEFLAFLARKTISDSINDNPQALRNAFKLFSANGDYIDIESMKKLLKDINEPINEKSLESIKGLIEEANMTGEPRISFKEFQDIMQSK